MNRLLIFCFLILSGMPVCAQVFRGQVTNESGEALPYAALYIRELNSGFVTDDSGYFRTTLEAGNYTCEVSSLGYSKKLVSIHIPPEGLIKDIVLTEQVYQLREVSITRNNEDPAYTVMRHAIANAPKNRYRVQAYTADTYLKGSGKITDVPGIFMLSAEFRADAAKYMNRVFLLEDQRTVTYTAPDKWDNEIIASSSTFPEGINILIHTSDINLYPPQLFGRVSPLSPGAFNYYKFKLEGCYSEGEYLINKIRVIPEKDNPELLSGHLYVVEDLWCLSGVDLNVSGLGMKGTVKVTCSEVEPSLFLTTSISLESSMSVLGMKAQASYLSSIKYTNIVQSENPLMGIQAGEVIHRPDSLTNLSRKQLKTLEEIKSLTAKDDLSTRDAYKLSKLMSRSIQLADTTRVKYKYERKPHNYNSHKDSLADSRDSLYWESVRSTPLTEEELASYAYKKVLDGDSTSTGKKKKTSIGGEIMEVLMIGKTYNTRNKKAWLTLKNLQSMVPEYNFVDGWWIGTKLQAGIKLSESSALTFTPQAHYTTARHEWVATGTLALDYAPRNLGRLWLNGGSTSSDFNRQTGESRIINSYSSLLFARNDMKLYDRVFFNAGNQIELTNSMLFTSAMEWERRNSLENHHHKSLFKKKARINIPRNPDYQPMPQNDLFKLSFSLTYTPAHYYRMIQGKKYYENSAYPTFGVTYEQAFNHGGQDKLTPSYKKIEMFIRQKIVFGMFNNLDWYINGGIFCDTKDMQFPDFRHFTATRLPVTEHSMTDGFSLADNYALSTNTRWAQAHVMWSTPYLLLKHLPFLRKKYFDEALHLRTFVAFKRQPYSEVGYSIGLLEFGRVGVFVSFDRLKYNSTGITVSIPFMKIIGE